MDIYKSVLNLKGVGEKTNENLNNMGIYTIYDLLTYFPRTYNTINEENPIYFNGVDLVSIKATLIKITRPFRTRTGKTIVTAYFSTNFGKLKVTFFNMPYVVNNYKEEETYTLVGKFEIKGKNIESVNPISGKNINPIDPKYHLKGKVSDNLIKKLLNQVLDGSIINENLPKEFLKEENLISLDKAIRSVHFPETKEDLIGALDRLKFQELFSYSLKILLAKFIRIGDESGIVFNMSPNLKKFKNSLPYKLTKSQSKSIREILLDQKRKYPMNRILQGDVGSGKTIVALTALYNIIEDGYQGAFMVPTEILANQHFKEAKEIYKNFDIDIYLLTGSTKKRDRELILKKINMEKPLLLIGTHALIEDDVIFNNIGLLITDEQHRFGVNQRAKLLNKNKASDVLVMSATPIPRTMALAIYSDLEISSITDLPPGRKKIKTKILNVTKRNLSYERLYSEIKKGRQGYVVTPLISENEDLNIISVEEVYKNLKKGLFKDVKVEMLHGQMTSKEKEEIMESFSRGEIKVLVSTTVIEVGINVSNATMIIIENAERFGLAQLHQLRGRVGRSSHQSFCILNANIKSPETMERLKTMEESNDGFYIAEKDLLQRGSGELFGVNQSGSAGLILSDLTRDYKMFLKSNKYAKIVFDDKNNKYIKVKKEFLRNLSENLNFICLN